MQVTINWKRASARQLEFPRVDEPFKLTEAVRAYVWDYGITQILNDAGSAAKTASEKIAMAEKKLAALMAGDLRAARETDPIRAEALRLAIESVGRRPDMKAASAKAVREKALTYLEVFIPRAKQNIAEQAALDAMLDAATLPEIPPVDAPDADPVSDTGDDQIAPTDEPPAQE